ncbi:unnamed protein product [Allacma fusca]|uniref:Uncharacterized protein n=1 Tax=Allacma fusca TaxID=39272 RepID=A0A8J2LRX7_9HEXA|nr:unnamed protein product [Allacma fusca]
MEGCSQGIWNNVKFPHSHKIWSSSSLTTVRKDFDDLEKQNQIALTQFVVCTDNTHAGYLTQLTQMVRVFVNGNASVRKLC